MDIVQCPPRSVWNKKTLTTIRDRRTHTKKWIDKITLVEFSCLCVSICYRVCDQKKICSSIHIFELIELERQVVITLSSTQLME